MRQSAHRPKYTAKILVVDDNAEHVELTEGCLIPMGYEVVAAYGGEEALRQVEAESPDLIILDLLMPGMDGYEVCRRLKDNDHTARLPIIMVTAAAERQHKLKALEAGADDFIGKPFDRAELLTRVASLVRIKQLTDELDSAKDILLTLVLALEARDPYTRGHSQRVAELATLLADRIGLPTREQRLIRTAALLHDIGKLGVDHTILNKPGPLAPKEYTHILEHAPIGGRICQPLGFARPMLPIIVHHHERYNGQGYPHRLARAQIPLGARIVCIADAYDAMLSDRPYRPALTKEQALSELRAGAGKQFDPRLLETFIAIVSKSDNPRDVVPDSTAEGIWTSTYR